MPRANQTSPFDRIRRVDMHGEEYWSARELSKLLGYTRWEQFPGVIAKAYEACASSGYAVSDHFREMSKMIVTGKGARRPVQDWHLTRYACYLVAQNADPGKAIVAQAQTYFAVQTRRAELADATSLPDADVDDTEDVMRIVTREQIRHGNTRLAGTARKAGVTTGEEFAQFHNAGYRGLYDGRTAEGIAVHKGLKKNQPVLDYMGAAESAANLFRITQTDEKLRRDEVHGKSRANDTHEQVGRVIRQAMKQLGATMPEDLPTPTQSVEALKRIRQRRSHVQPKALPAPKRRVKDAP